jgi:hypothetical protein
MAPQQAMDHGLKIMPPNWGIKGFAVDYVLAVNPGEMYNRLIVDSAAEDEPRLALIAQAAFGDDTHTSLNKGIFNAIKLSQFLLGPIPRLASERG